MPPVHRPTSLRKRRALHQPIVLTLADLLCVVAGLLLTYWIRFHAGLIEVTKGYLASDYRRLLPVVTVLWMVSLGFSHLYRRDEKIWSWRVAGRVIRAAFLALAMFVTTIFFFRNLTVYEPARVTIPIAMVTVSTLIGLMRHVLHRRLVVSARMSGRGLARALVLGFGENAKEIVRSLRRHPEYGWQAVGFVSDDPENVGGMQTGLPVMGTVAELPELLQSEAIEAIFVAQTDFRHERLGDVFVECQKRMVDIKLVPDCTEMLFSQVNIEEVDGIPFVGLRDTPLHGWNIVIKRLFDLAVSGALLIIWAPLMAILAWVVRRDSPGPILFRQERVGADGSRFDILKFRTMVVNAETKTGPVFSDPSDPRQTRTGRWLRRTHLDELPQLLNVLRGEMSLVGPRPERPYFVDQFREEIPRYMARHRIKSGMTGWAQINGQRGHEGSIADRLKFDLYYIENWSLLFDLKILVLTGTNLLKRIRSGE